VRDGGGGKGHTHHTTGMARDEEWCAEEERRAGEEESRVGGFVVAWEKEINAASVLCVFGGVWAHLC